MEVTKKNRMFIFDPCFGGMTGHWENYCKRLYHELASRGYEVKIFGQAKTKENIIDGVNFEALFDCSPYGSVRNYLELNRLAGCFLQDFKKLDSNQFQDGDIFIFHSLFPHTFAAIVDWTKEVIKSKKIIATFFFQFPPSETKQQAGWMKRVYYRVRRRLSGEKSTTREMDWVDNNNVRLYQKAAEKLKGLVGKSHILMASTDVLSRNFRALLSIDVKYLPMPGVKMRGMEQESEKTAPLNHSSCPPITIGYFGHSAIEKGGHFLQYFVEKINANYPQAKFILHINPNQDTKDCLAYFNQHPYENIECVFGHVEQEQMLSLMGRTDIILMPYSHAKYATMPSAIFTEGMPLRKIFVLPKHTWAYHEALKYNAGISAFDHFTKESILKAIKKAIVNFNHLKEMSKIAGVKFYRENNMKNYIDTFESILEKSGARA